MKSVIKLYVAALLLLPSMAFANCAVWGDFPPPQNVRTENGIIKWDAPMLAADDLPVGGYNIYYNPDVNGYANSYLDTVRGTEEYAPTLTGSYRISAFDESTCNTSSLHHNDNITAIFDGGVSQTTSVTPYYNWVYINRVTCQNVGPGESCIASCQNIWEGSNNTLAGPATGGSCSTSDIVEADAWAGGSTYSCTVPTFSGEVTAAVYCLNLSKFR